MTQPPSSDLSVGNEAHALANGHSNGFSFHESPPVIWPQFLIGQCAQPVRVLLVDSDPHTRQVITQQLLADDRIDLVAQAEGVRDGRRRITHCEFDVLLVDINLTDGGGFDLIEEARRRRPNVEVVVISASADESQVLKAIGLGANGFLVKNSWFDSFPQAVLQVVNDGAAISPNLARRLFQHMDARVKPGQHKADSRAKLSDRECEVLRLVALGFTSTEIGRRLVISVNTVNAHVRNLYGKLQVKKRAQAVSCAVERGLI